MERYTRQIMIPGFGKEGQERLDNARVLLVGVGGLGSPISSYLCAAGIGRLGIIDADNVGLSNLQRQILYTEEDLGHSKVESAKHRLSAMNRNVHIDAYDFFLDRGNARDIISGYDIVVDGCDNFSTRFLIDDVCAELQKPYVYASIESLAGQVSVFYKDSDSQKYHRLRNLYDESLLSQMPEPDKSVLGPIAGVVGSVAAAQTVLLATRLGEPLIGKLWTIDLLTMASYTINL